MSKSTPLKSATELCEVPRRPTTPVPPVEPPNPLHEALSQQMEQARREFHETTERLRAENLALSERRRPASEALDRLRRLVEIVGNGRRYLASARARAEHFTALVITQLGGGGSDLNLLNDIANNDPASASAERLVGIVSPWLADKEQELADTLVEAKRLAADAPDNAALLAETEQLAVAVGAAKI